MTLFWALAILMLAAAVGTLVWPLMTGQDNAGDGDGDALNVIVFEDRCTELEREHSAGHLTAEQYARSRRELERELLRDTGRSGPAGITPQAGGWAAPVVTAAVPMLALGLYFHFGSMQMVEGVPAGPGPHTQAGGTMADDMDEVVAKLRENLRSRPDDVQGWLLLARTLVVMERNAEAVNAVRQGRELAGNDPALLSEQAELMAMARDGDLAGEPMALVRQALAQEPAQPHALWLAGLHAAQQQRFADAVGFWTRLLELTPEDDDGREMIRTNIERARKALNDAGAATEQPPTTLQVAVSLAPELAARASAGDPVFIFARTEGTRAGMPPAVVRIAVEDLPSTVALTPPENHETVVVARIAKGGGVTARSGDLEGRHRVGPARKETVELVIDTVVP